MRSTGLSRNLREALLRLASHKEITLMEEQLAERLEHEQAEAETEEPVEFDILPAVDVDWSEGVEELRPKTPEELYRMLGLERHSIPFFREKISKLDLSGEHRETESATATEGFALRWHQLVGLVKMTERALTSQPVLLMDDVGLGKTVQVLALFATLAYYREVYRKSEKYPGIWGKRCFNDSKI
jgi:SNF2 family DNA or RNA helicase